LTFLSVSASVGESKKKNHEELMTNRFRMTLLLTILAGFAAAFSALPARAQQFSPWSAPVNLNNVVLNDGTVCPAVVNSTSPDVNDALVALSRDGLSLYLGSTRPGGLGEYDLWVSHRDRLDACWGAPVNVGPPVNTSVREGSPSLSPDGHWLFFHSKRQPGSCGNGVPIELWAAHRPDIGNDLGWEPPINLGCAIHGGLNAVKNPASGLFTDSFNPRFFDDGSGKLYLYFTRNTFPGDQPGTHIYVSTCNADIDDCNTQGLWDQGIPVTALNSPFRDGGSAIRLRDGLEMIITSARPGSLASDNLWVSTRATTQDQNWLPPEPINCDAMQGCSTWNPIGPLVNSNVFDGGPALSWDATELYFFRVRPDLFGVTGCQDPAEPPEFNNVGCRDLYVSKRTYITITDLSSSPNPSVFGQSVTFTATVSSSAESAPTGTVTFLDGATNLGSSMLASGQATFTTSSLAIGSHFISGQYNGDRISSTSSGRLTQNVGYRICPLFDQTRSAHSGATFPIKLQLCDADGDDVSSPMIVVHASSLSAVSGFSGTPDAPGNANPDNDFRFDATLGPTGGYIFNLSTGGLASGTYSLQFIAGTDPITHSVNFGVN
jgi:hypothetical protein